MRLRRSLVRRENLLGHFKGDAAENEGRGLCLLGGRLEGCFLLLDLVGTGLRTRM